ELVVEDLTGLEENEREPEARKRAAEEAGLPFDLTAGPLMRVRLLKLGAEDHVLLCTMHHIISDGWSMAVLTREVGLLYEAYSRGQQSPLGELEVQYVDYAIWQREWVRGEILEQEISYWKRQLGGAPPLLELRTDLPRPAIRSGRGAKLGFAVPG